MNLYHSLKSVPISYDESREVSCEDKILDAERCTFVASLVFPFSVSVCTAVATHRICAPAADHDVDITHVSLKSEMLIRSARRHTLPSFIGTVSRQPSCLSDHLFSVVTVAEFQAAAFVHFRVVVDCGASRAVLLFQAAESSTLTSSYLSHTSKLYR